MFSAPHTAVADSAATARNSSSLILLRHCRTRRLLGPFEANDPKGDDDTVNKFLNRLKTKESQWNGGKSIKVARDRHVSVNGEAGPFYYDDRKPFSVATKNRKRYENVPNRNGGISSQKQKKTR